jgi:D-alanyl-D-alanine dipeptidase
MPNEIIMTTQLPPSFVYLHDIDPSIRLSLRYFSTENFAGQIIDGYRSNKAVMTKEAAIALSNAQKQFMEDGYCMVLYDSYRPQTAVNSFMRWSQDLSAEGQKNKDRYYPRVDKTKVFDLGYIAARSGHSRGSTVDITLIEVNKTLSDNPAFSARHLPAPNEHISFPFIDDNTVDMGSSFDLFDEISHHDSLLISAEHLERRNYLRRVMEANFFFGDDQEWWHYTLHNEPHQDTYFDFIVIG